MTDMKRDPAMTGGCQCGAVRYALLSEPTHASICHCRMCQKAFGNCFGAAHRVPNRDLVWTRGAPGTFRSSEAVERGFCRECGTPLTFRYVEQDRICVSIGSLDEPGRIRPEIQYGIESRLGFPDSAPARGGADGGLRDTDGSGEDGLPTASRPRLGRRAARPIRFFRTRR